LHLHPFYPLSSFCTFYLLPFFPFPPLFYLKVSIIYIVITSKAAL
jgi:hypothetical protein